MTSTTKRRPDTCCPAAVFERRASDKGFTLLEVVMALIVLAIVSLVVAPVLTTGVSALMEARNHADRERQATLALERFVRDVRVAEHETLETEDGGMTLRFISLRDDGEVTYRLGDDQLTRSGPDGEPRVLASGIRASDGGDGAFRFGDTPVPHATISVVVDGIGEPYQATGVLRQ